MLNGNYAFANWSVFLFDNRPERQVECNLDYKQLRCLAWLRVVMGIGVTIIPMVDGILCL